MHGQLISIITSSDPSRRDQSLDAVAGKASLKELLAQCDALESFRRQSDNLYERVRALFFLYAIHRFHLPFRPETAALAPIPFEGFQHLLDRRFEQALAVFRGVQAGRGPSAAISSALAAAYRGLAF